MAAAPKDPRPRPPAARRAAPPVPAHLPSARRRAQGQPVAPPARSAATGPDPRNVVEFRGVSMHYPDGGIGLADVTFNVRRGEFLFLVGSTGSGKSTVMRLLTKALEPTEGHVRVAGRALREMPRSKVPYYRRNLGVVFQDFKLLPNRTVYDNVAYALSATGATRKEIRAKVPDVLRLTGPVDEAAQLPRPALRRRAAARVASRARSSTTRRCCWPTSRPATSTRTPRWGSCSCCTASTAPARPCSSPRTTTHLVDRMRRRVIELRGGRIIRDEATGMYAVSASRRPTSSATCSSAPSRTAA